MARKRVSEAADETEKIDHAAGEVAAGLAAELEACRQAIDYCIKTACDETLGDYDANREGNLESASKLMLASAALAGALAKLKGEFHQRITVKREEPAEGAGKRVYPRLAGEGGD